MRCNLLMASLAVLFLTGTTVCLADEPPRHGPLARCPGEVARRAPRFGRSGARPAGGDHHRLAPPGRAATSAAVKDELKIGLRKDRGEHTTLGSQTLNQTPFPHCLVDHRVINP
jgi:hypothetical protein